MKTTTTTKPVNVKLSNSIKKGKRIKANELDEMIASAVAKDKY